MDLLSSVISAMNLKKKNRGRLIGQHRRRTLRWIGGPWARIFFGERLCQETNDEIDGVGDPEAADRTEARSQALRDWFVNMGASNACCLGNEPYEAGASTPGNAV